MIRPLGWLEKLEGGSFEGRLVVSVLLHLLTIVSVSAGWLIWAKPMAAAGTAHGARITLMYMPGRALTLLEASHGDPVPTASRKLAVLQRKRTPAPAASHASRVAVHPDAIAGNDARGTGSASILLIQAFPKETPDMSQYSGGKHGDVVVDVHIDNQGRVIDARAKTGMGRRIDEIVVATVEQWIFSPATKNGKPAMSEQELHFHYDHGDDPSCGWACFALVQQ